MDDFMNEGGLQEDKKRQAEEIKAQDNVVAEEEKKDTEPDENMKGFVTMLKTMLN